MDPTIYRDPELSKRLVKSVQRLAVLVSGKLGRLPALMEVCGTHTMAISRAGLRSLFKDYLELKSGPGCPVCVTDQRDIDVIIAAAKLPNTILATFGDMMRVPGSRSSLERERAAGANVRVVYSPADAVDLAASQPDKEVVFAGIGFETTAPTVAASVLKAMHKGVKNYSVLSMHKLVPPVMRALLEDPEIRIDGFILPGHVSTIIGRKAFEFLEEYGIPSVISGFEQLDILGALHTLLEQILDGKAQVINGYSRVVSELGNLKAQALIAEVFEPEDASWRGFGTVPESGLGLKQEHARYNAKARFKDLEVPEPVQPRGCSCGAVLKGQITPKDCKLFAKTCTPLTPVGPCMVSSEGSCAAYYRYERTA